ncbi:unnamed protein product [Paramecium primaurelia]|uniref:Uncharacterized protein n=1 Tax=Paramecium primaurelia TaxID=5886 RepID=A0A8S1L0D7_PARPR|nr:unnamed protein product [Paramecium primaurelia]
MQLTQFQDKILWNLKEENQRKKREMKIKKKESKIDLH